MIVEYAPMPIRKKIYHDPDKQISAIVKQFKRLDKIKLLQAMWEFLHGTGHNTQITLKNLFRKSVDFVYLLKFKETFLCSIA